MSHVIIHLQSIISMASAGYAMFPLLYFFRGTGSFPLAFRSSAIFTVITCFAEFLQLIHLMAFSEKADWGVAVQWRNSLVQPGKPISFNTPHAHWRESGNYTPWGWAYNAPLLSRLPEELETPNLYKNSFWCKFRDLESTFLRSNDAINAKFSPFLVKRAG